jgi:MFS family permease
MRTNVTALAVCQAIMMTCNSLVIATAALVGYALAEDKARATLPVALMFLGSMVTTVPASHLMQRIGRRAGFRLAAVVGASGAALAASGILTHDFVRFCAGIVLVGCFNGFGLYYRFAAAESADDTFRSRAISLVLGGGVVAAFAGPNLAVWSQHFVQGYPFAGSYAILVALYIATFIVVGWVRVPVPVVSGGGRPLREIARQPAFMVAVVTAMIAYGVMSLVMTATPLAMQSHAHTFGDTSLVIQWHVFAMYAPAFVTGQLIARLGIRPVMLWGSLLAMGCVAVNLAGTAVPFFWVALVLLGVGWNFMFVGATTLLTETYTETERAKAQAFNDLLVLATVIAASLSSGALEFHLGWRAVNLGVLPMLGVGVLLVIRLRRRTVAAAA